MDGETDQEFLHGDHLNFHSVQTDYQCIFLDGNRQRERGCHVVQLDAENQSEVGVEFIHRLESSIHSGVLGHTYGQPGSMDSVRVTTKKIQRNPDTYIS